MFSPDRPKKEDPFMYYAGFREHADLIIITVYAL